MFFLPKKGQDQSDETHQQNSDPLNANFVHIGLVTLE